MFIPLNAHTMYVPLACKDAFIHVQNCQCINMLVYRDIHSMCICFQKYIYNILQHCTNTSYTWYRHDCTRLCQVVRIPDVTMNLRLWRLARSDDQHHGLVIMMLPLSANLKRDSGNLKHVPVVMGSVQVPCLCCALWMDCVQLEGPLPAHCR